MNDAELPSTATIEAALAEAYRRPELNAPGPPAWRVWIAERLQQVLEWIASVLPVPQIGEGGATALSWLVMALIAVVAVAALARVALRLARGRRAAPDARSDPGGSDALPDLDADRWRRRARDEAEAGRWREASLALYNALLIRLDSTGVLRYHPAKTPGDYRREVRRDARAAPVFERFLRGFEPVAYGARPLDADGFAGLWQLVDEAGTHG